MKTIPKHLVTVLPRVRSNSVSSPRLYTSSSLSLFDSPAPPPSRPVLSSNRLYLEGKPAEVEGSQNSQHHSHSHPPFSLALAQPQSSSGQTLANSNPQGQYALFPYSSLAQSTCAHPHAQQAAQETHNHPRPKRQRLKYQLDVGAYGIPKRCRTTPSSRRHHSHSAHQHSSTEDITLAVQIGEDAYFVRDNAMGVADGVGGWSKSHSTRPASTPSALFARRLMHYCSAEVEYASQPRAASPEPISPSSTAPAHIPQQSGSGSRLHPPSRPQFSFTHHLRPRPPPPPSTTATSPAWKWSDSSMSSSLPSSFTLHDVFNRTTTPPPPTSQDHNHFTFSPFTYPEEYSAAEREYEEDASDLEQDLEDSLEELSEGIDVLQILERAYDKTLKAHVVPGPESIQPQSSSTLPPRSETVSTAPSASTSTTAQNQGEPKPLLTGSSTALLAVLDHPPRPSHVSPSPPSSSSSTKNASSTPISVIPSPTSTSSPNASTSTYPSSKTTSNSHSYFSSSTPTSTLTSAATQSDYPNAASYAPKLNGSSTAQTPLKASTATATAASSSASSVPLSSSIRSGFSSESAAESTPVECELEECEGEYDAVIKIAHVGDCMGMLVRGEEIVWRSEEMWWDFNTPVQLGPSTQETVTPRNSAMVITIPVKADDILILASDGLSDNLWDEDVLDEVVRFKKSFLDSSATNASTPSAAPLDGTETDSGYSSSSSAEEPFTPSPLPNEPTAPAPATTATTTLKRKTLAGMLSEALCSRARRVSERKVSNFRPTLSSSPEVEIDVDEVPFARRAREAGRRFVGGKNDDISVVVAVISPRAK
ncbi:hypothetical protein NP233_g37 [Leucocoprinus birnbaumii]|uniref:PPM-type phosphatase domain-containing protein n=1 Tax=Leucocoprinus birnbaumii TaxID=56174 RepID=A0AAD5W343_9AGAR|nr:hypothetical protein NP233_g37 [Leucocoprinus birnbaumii]